MTILPLLKKLPEQAKRDFSSLLHSGECKRRIMMKMDSMSEHP
jgi:hypothetical protein